MEFDERECLANAFQCHITDLVDGIVFTDSELPDWLISEECFTEDECSNVRKISDRKDQIRILISMIKGRDFKVLQKFLGQISRHNPEIAEKVRAKFERNKQEGIKGKLCAYCKLKKGVNIKLVADTLWADKAIEDGLYNKIIFTNSPVGNQDTLWREVVQGFHFHDPKRSKKAHELLLQALSTKNGLSHHVQGVQQMLIRNHDKLTCSCEPRISILNDIGRNDTSDESYCPRSSISNRSGSDVTSANNSEP